MIKNLFTEICKRGCLIETKSDYPIDHLPKCLVTVNDNLIEPRYNKQADFMISSIIPGSNHLYFTKSLEKICINRGDNRSITEFFMTWINENLHLGKIQLYESNDYRFHRINMAQLDFVTHYLYTNGNCSYKSDLMGNIYHVDEIGTFSHILPSYKENVRTKMISNLINDEGLFEFIRRIDYILLIPKEIKLFIMILFMKLDNWNNVGVQMNLFLK